MNQTLLQVRKLLKEKKPDFIRQDTSKRMKLKIKWRKPKGHHSKIRHSFAGRRRMPSPGYKSPIEVRGLHATGLKSVRICSPEELNNIKKGNEGIIVSKSVGLKKRLDIFRKANEMKIKVLNLNADEAIKKIEDFMSSKKKSSEKKPKEKAEVKTEPKKEEKKIDSKEENKGAAQNA